MSLLVSLLLNVPWLATFGQMDRLALATKSAPVSAATALDLAQSHETKGERAQATYYYRLYLRRAPAARDGLLIAERIGEVLFSEQSQGRGLLEVDSPGAVRAKVDGQVYSDLPVAVFVASGEHELEVAFADHTQKKRVGVSTGRATLLFVEPEKQVAMITRQGPTAQTEAVERRAPSRGWRVIAHPSVREIDENSLRELFTGKRVVSQNGRMLQAVLGPTGSPARSAFLQRFLGQTEGSFRTTWTRVVFRGNDAIPPLELASDEEVIQAVRSRPGMVGVVSADQEARNVAEVKILR